MKELGLRLDAKKSVHSPVQRTTYLGVVLDWTTMQARMSPARIESILTAVARVREGWSLTVKQFQRLLGLMAAASTHFVKVRGESARPKGRTRYWYAFPPKANLRNFL